MSNDIREWLATDGLGGFACGVENGTRTRRNHGILCVASPHDGRRWMLVSGLDVWVEGGDGHVPLSTHLYAPGVRHPDGVRRLESFVAEPWPSWRFHVREDLEIVQELFMPRGRAAAFLSWKVISARGASVQLHVRPLLSGRELSALHRENDAFGFGAERRGDHHWAWSLYDGVPTLVAFANGSYSQQPVWYRNFAYPEDGGVVEDLASPGVFTWTLAGGTAAELMFSVPESWTGYHVPGDLARVARAVREAERARIAAYRSRLFHSADAYVQQRGAGGAIVTRYPDAAEHERVTYAALPGLCLTTHRLDEAEHILVRGADDVVASVQPEGSTHHRTVDAPLWFVIAVDEFLTTAARRGHWFDDAVRHRLTDACQEVLEAYARGTHSGIRQDDDCLLAAGEPGSNAPLTWMDAVTGLGAVTPRVGKPVEVQALWINALTVGARWSERWGDVGEQATRAFAERFWNAERRCLHDVVDVDHVAGTADTRIRPNQILAVGGLPAMVVTGECAMQIVETVEQHLWTPMGLRTLASDDPEYAGRYEGDVTTKQKALHNGTVWPWLAGPFVDAWVRTRAAERATGTARVPVGLLKALRVDARKRFLPALARHLDVLGIGHASELADGDAPHTPRGAPFSAWSVGELARAMVEG